MVFETKTGSIYYVDTKNKVISGDNAYVRDGKKYVNASVMIGQSARFYMPDGAIFETSPVKKYIN